MKKEEFDDWLESIGGLENGFYSDREPITKSIASVGDGWLPLIKELIEKCIELGWDKQICQIKEKFGGLRFYINSAPEEVHKLIAEYENKSYHICEECGKEGELRSDLRWWLTLCDDHYLEKKK